MAGWLQNTSKTHPAIVSPSELAAAIASSNSNSTNAAQRWAALAPGLLQLAAKAAVMLVLSVLAGLLLPAADKAALLKDQGGQLATPCGGSRCVRHACPWHVQPISSLQTGHQTVCFAL